MGENHLGTAIKGKKKEIKVEGEAVRGGKGLSHPLSK